MCVSPIRKGNSLQEADTGLTSSYLLGLFPPLMSVYSSFRVDNRVAFVAFVQRHSFYNILTRPKRFDLAEPSTRSVTAQGNRTIM